MGLLVFRLCSLDHSVVNGRVKENCSFAEVGSVVVLLNSEGFRVTKIALQRSIVHASHLK